MGIQGVSGSGEGMHSTPPPVNMNVLAVPLQIFFDDPETNGPQLREVIDQLLGNKNISPTTRADLGKLEGEIDKYKSCYTQIQAIDKELNTFPPPSNSAELEQERNNLHSKLSNIGDSMSNLVNAINM